MVLSVLSNIFKYGSEHVQIPGHKKIYIALLVASRVQDIDPLSRAGRIFMKNKKPSP